MGDYPWFPTYSNDWLGSNKITAMNIAEEGAYHRLLCCQWNEPDCTLPADIGELKVLARISGSILENHIDFSRIAKCFVAHPSKPNRVYNVRLMEEFKKMKRLRKEKSEAGKRGNAIRWGSHSDHKAIAEPIANDRSSQSQSQSQEEKKKKEKTFSSDSCEVRLSELLFDLIRSRLPEAKVPNFQTWAKSVDLMIRCDRRPPELIEAMMRFSQADDFWQSNVLSTAALRKQFERLLDKSRKQTTSSKPLTVMGKRLQELQQMEREQRERDCVS